MTQLHSNLAYTAPQLTVARPQAQAVRFQGEAPQVQSAQKETQQPPAAADDKLPKNFILKAIYKVARWTKDLVVGFVKDMKTLFNKFVDLLKGPPEHNHDHGPGESCGHNHPAHEDKKGHSHAPGESCGHDHPAHEDKKGHVHGPGCNHDHDDDHGASKMKAGKPEPHVCGSGCNHHKKELVPTSREVKEIK